MAAVCRPPHSNLQVAGGSWGQEWPQCNCSGSRHRCSGYAAAAARNQARTKWVALHFTVRFETAVGVGGAARDVAEYHDDDVMERFVMKPR